MPRMNKGGKFIFGISVVRDSGMIQLPPQAIEEYHICSEGRVYLFTGSKSTGGFCVTRKGLPLPSMLGHILTGNPGLMDYSIEQERFVRYKGRSYCWAEISRDGGICLSRDTLHFLRIDPGMELLSIRSSDIAFTMGAKGPLLERAGRFEGAIPVY